MDKMKLAHDWAIKNGSELIYKTVEEAWQYADAMQAEADKRKKAEASKQSVEVHDLIGKAHFHYCENGACVHCGKSEKTIDDEMWRRVEEARAVGQEEWQPDWSQAPNDAIGWMIFDGVSTWLGASGYLIEDAPSFGFTGTHIVERPHGF